ncbi:HNH endonuclease [Rhizobium leguminosarum bv. viciae]|nr:HNH endonuclease [Rhizobium leguminosarum bv. viciae]
MARNRYYDSPHWKALKRATHERDGWRCVVPGCGRTDRLVCDHIVTRPNVDHPTALDVIGNTRTFCGHHDRQVKEQRGGARRRGGNVVVQGCTVDGAPLDPRHPWHRSKP